MKNQKTLVDFKKAQSLISKMIDMTGKDHNSINTMHQNLSAARLLKKAQKDLMENYIASCFNNGMIDKKSEKKAEMTREILRVTRLFNK